MGWDVCSSPPWVPFYPYTMFPTLYLDLPVKMKKTIITQNVLVTQCSNIVHCDWYTQKCAYMCRGFKPFQTFSCWIQCCMLCNFLWFLSGGVKSLQTAKIFTFCWFWVGKVHQNCLSGMYIGFDACQIQWHLFKVSTISQFLNNHNFRRHIA